MTEVTSHVSFFSKVTFFTGYQQASNQIIVSFMGSAYFENWVHDFDATMVDYPACKELGCKVHRGFYTAYLSVRTQVIAQLMDLKKRHADAKINITGHSLGGALVNFLLADLQEETFTLTRLADDNTTSSFGNGAVFLDSTNPSKDREPWPFTTFGGDNTNERVTISLADSISYPHYTYGAPRFGNAAMGVYLNSMNSENPGSLSTVFRVVNSYDPVVHLPPTFLGAFHVSQEVFYDEKFAKAVVCSETDPEDPNCSAKFFWYRIEQIEERMDFHLRYFNQTLYSRYTC